MRHIQSVWAHWYAVHIHMVAALLSSCTDPIWLRFWWSGSRVEWNDVITSWLRLPSYSNCFPHPYKTYTVFEHIDMLSIGIWYLAVLLSYTQPTWLRLWWSGSLVESKWCHSVIVEATILFKLLPLSIIDIYKVFEHIDMLSIDIC